jgi:hypothetical protein
MEKKNIVTCTPNEFVKVLSGLVTPQFAAGIFDTPVDMDKYDEFHIIVDGKKKKNPNAVLNPYYSDGVRCVSKKYKLVTGFNYGKCVNNRLVDEGKDPNFVSGTTWYTLVNPFLAVHKNDPTKFYFRYQYLPNSIIDADYYFQGNGIQRMMFTQYLKDKSNTYKKQGLENELKVQVVAIENIIEVTINGTTYVLIHPNAPSYRLSYINQSAGNDDNNLIIDSDNNN